jgi:hypothetical protein
MRPPRPPARRTGPARPPAAPSPLPRRNGVERLGGVGSVTRHGGSRAAEAGGFSPGAPRCSRFAIAASSTGSARRHPSTGRRSAHGPQTSRGGTLLRYRCARAPPRRALSRRRSALASSVNTKRRASDACCGPTTRRCIRNAFFWQHGT